MSYMGLDVGTTGCKAVAFSEEGRLLAAAYREYELLTPQPGWAELDSELVCEQCLAVIREASAACGRDPVRSLGISSQGEAFTPVDQEGRALGNAMVSSDARAAELAAGWSAEFGRERLYEITGHTAAPLFTLFKLLWLRENRPEVWSKAARFHCFEDLLHLRLGLEPTMSWPLAGRTMLFDVRKHEWSGEILAAAGLDADQLARPMRSGSVAGTIPRSVADSLGLPQGVVVAAGGHDQSCGALGSGATRAGSAMYATGTVECICPTLAQPVLSDELFRSNLCTYDHALPGAYTTVAYSLTGGNLLKWFRDQWAQTEVREAGRIGADVYDLVLAGMTPEPSGLLVLPYFTPSGTPHFDAEVPGAILGLRLTTTRGEILRALLEGVALEMRLNVEILEASGVSVSEFRAVGGGARSGALTQLKADVLGRQITTVEVTEAGCLGAAVLACSAATGEKPETLAEKWVRTGPAVEPDPARAPHYAGRFEDYRRLYPALKQFHGGETRP